MVLQGPHEVLCGVAHVLLDERHAWVVEGGPAVDDAVAAAPVPLIDHREIKLIDPRWIDLQGDKKYIVAAMRIWSDF